MNTDPQGLCFGCFQRAASSTICPECGFTNDTDAFPTALRCGARVSKYIVGKVLGRPGGFGITYLAFDTVLSRRVALKELMPRDLVARRPDGETLQIQTRDDAAVFKNTLDSFLAEARMVAQFNHPNVVKVLDFFEANGTAYFAMEYYHGESLPEYVRRSGGRLPEAEAISLILPVLDALSYIHAQPEPVLHRDLKPANIYLTRDRKPILLDFGAARVVMGLQSRTLSAILTPGFAPFEQYSPKGNQGPWTDVYAAAATLHYLLTGAVPPEANERIDDRTPQSPRAVVPGLSEPVSHAIMLGLNFLPQDRPQSAREFAEALSGRTGATSVIPEPGPRPYSQGETTLLWDGAKPAATAPPVLRSTQVEAVTAPPPSSRKTALVAASVAAMLILAFVAYTQFGPEPTPVGDPAAVVPPSAAADSRATGLDSSPITDRGSTLPPGAVITSQPSAAPPGPSPRPQPQTPAQTGRGNDLPSPPTTSTLAASAPTVAAPAVSAPTPPAAAVPPVVADRVLIVVTGSDRAGVNRARSALGTAAQGVGGLRVVDEPGLSLSSVDGAGIRSLAQHGVAVVVVAELTSSAVPGMGPFFSGSAQLDIAVYRVVTGERIDGGTFVVGEGNSPPMSEISDAAARSAATAEVLKKAASVVPAWISKK